jgi:hypothetical protein
LLGCAGCTTTGQTKADLTLQSLTGITNLDSVDRIQLYYLSESVLTRMALTPETLMRGKQYQVVLDRNNEDFRPILDALHSSKIEPTSDQGDVRVAVRLHAGNGVSADLFLDRRKKLVIVGGTTFKMNSPLFNAAVRPFGHRHVL